MDQVVGGQVYQRIASLEAEVARLKPYEPKPWKVPGGWLFIAFLLGGAVWWITSHVLDSRADRYRYGRDY